MKKESKISFPPPLQRYSSTPKERRVIAANANSSLKLSGRERLRCPPKAPAPSEQPAAPPVCTENPPRVRQERTAAQPQERFCHPQRNMVLRQINSPRCVRKRIPQPSLPPGFQLPGPPSPSLAGVPTLGNSHQCRQTDTPQPRPNTRTAAQRHRGGPLTSLRPQSYTWGTTSSRGEDGSTNFHREF